MIKIEKNVNLKLYNTFGIEAHARYFCKISAEEQLEELLSSEVYKNEHHLILGGGSNILFTKDVEGLIIKVDLTGIKKQQETDDTIDLYVKAGEGWHNLVLYCVQHNLGGIENLSLIPGTVGAAPIQNIGAYGVEIKEVIKKVEAIDLSTGARRSFTNAECMFGYRESIFKHDLKEKYFISSVTLTVTTKNHLLNTSYGAIHDTLKAMHVIEPSIKTISDAVIHIRKTKLPDPATVGNAGSFFKNPTITLSHYEYLKKTNPSIPGYPSVNQLVKVPAGWLIEQCGWKGKRMDNVGVHAQQALVLVNYGTGKGNEILQLAKNIISSVKEKFDITLTPEVNII
ncbi:MAG: UDP-N-acetylmuramate dehydrogenase [Cyclobacteriaceae bacterium]|nr:UDP-N-acetylmuramate dehydrogenase [Cyclobacteriaceae bacterium]